MSKPPAASARHWFEQGLQFKRDGNAAAALDAFRQSIKLNPEVAAPWVALAQLLDANNQFEEAVQCLLHAVAAEPSDVLARQQLALAQQNLGDTEQAMANYQRALALQPDSEACHFGLGQLLEDLGEPERAARAYRQVLAIDPRSAHALAQLLGLGRHLDISAELGQAEALLPQLPAEPRALLGYGLGKAYQQQRRYDAAFGAFEQANKARRQVSEPFNRRGFEARIEQMKKIFSADFFTGRQGWGEASCQPVFIVGLPRTGTTLTEQILAAHSQCFGAGELAVLSDLATGTPDRLGDGDSYWPYCAPALGPEQIGAIGAEYLAQSARRCTTAVARVVDKQPLNFWHLGLIALALPGARIVHCRRDIRDCGLSIFSHNFNSQQNWSTDLADIAHYWRGYRRLMQHWRDTAGLEILELDYEALVGDFEPQARRLLEFVGLPWEDGVLQFHHSKRAVQTPSRWQVRQPVYQSARAQWRNYEQHLGPLLEAAKEQG